MEELAMKNILLILKEPFLDRIPSLKTLIWHLVDECQYNITVITTKSQKFPLITFSHENLNIITVKERTRRLEFPTTLKLTLCVIRHIILHKVDVIIGGDALGNVVANKINICLHKKYLFFMLEYPTIPAVSKFQKMELKAMKDADIVVTHDDWHKQFLVKNVSVDVSKVLCLPNASLTDIYKGGREYLRAKLQLTSEKIILHSGGFGKWFRCEELASSTINWSKDWKLIFHTSHSMNSNSYYNKVFNQDYNGKVLFSTTPVPTNELDALVGSADIGIALYDENELGYRATYMGLAAGKVGNYLKCGVPVIATRIISLRYLEDYRCGILVDGEFQIADAIQTILSDWCTYSENAYRCYQELWYPKRYLHVISSVL